MVLTCSSTWKGEVYPVLKINRNQKAATAEKRADICNLFYRLLHLNLVDLDAEQFVLKIVIEIETVSILHVFPSRVLIEDACFATGQGLQRTPELTLLCAGKQNDCHTAGASATIT